MLNIKTSCNRIKLKFEGYQLLSFIFTERGRIQIGTDCKDSKSFQKGMAFGGGRSIVQKNKRP